MPKQDTTNIVFHVSIKDTQVEELLKDLKKAREVFRIGSRRAFAPLDPFRLVEVVATFAGPVTLAGVSRLLRILQKHGEVTCDSLLDEAKRWYKERWPFVLVHMVCKKNYAYFLFKKGKKKFFWEFSEGETRASDL